MKKVLIASFVVFPLITSILQGEISILGMLGNCIFFGVLVFPGFALMHVSSRVFRASEWIFCWMPFLIWYIEIGWLGSFVSGKFEFRLLEYYPADIALLCSFVYYTLYNSCVGIYKR